MEAVAPEPEMTGESLSLMRTFSCNESEKLAQSRTASVVVAHTRTRSPDFFLHNHHLFLSEKQKLMCLVAREQFHW